MRSRVCMAVQLLLVVSLLGGIAGCADSSPDSTVERVLYLNNDDTFHRLGRYVDVLADPAGELSIDDVTSPEYNGQFLPLNAPAINMGITPVTFWFRFTIAGDAPDGGEKFWILHISRPFISTFQIYMPSMSGNMDWGIWTVIRAGEFDMADNAPPPFLDFEIPVSNKPRTVYIRARDNAIMFLPLDIFSPEGFRDHSRCRMLLLGLYVGIIVAMLLYNLFIFRTIHHLCYLWYVLYIGSLSIFILGINGFTYEYIHQGNPETMIRVDLFFLGIAFIGIIQFTSGFLGTRTEFPIGDRILRGMIIPSLLLVAVTPFADLIMVNHSYSFLGMILVAMIVCIAYAAMQRKILQAPYYLLAIGIIAVSGTIYVLTVRGIIPMSALTFHSLQIGSAAEAIFLSFALANSISNIQRDRDLAVKSEEHYRHLAVTDGLTNLYNSRYFRDRLMIEIRLAHRHAMSLCLIMLDVDYFKKFNDTRGHLEGDRLLAHLGSVIRQSVREMDIACRCGGEEFGIVLPGASVAQAFEIAERIRRSFQETSRDVFGDDVEITISAGTAELAGSETDLQLIDRADQALYEAKDSGRNRTVTAEKPA